MHHCRSSFTLVFVSMLAHWVFPVVASDRTNTPNVILIVSDDQGYGDLSCNGNPLLKTPVLDQLASESVRFSNFHVSPTCAPTRGAIMSGHYSNRAGTWHTIMGRSLLKTDQATMGEVFASNGYSTGMFGKWHLGDNYPFRPQDRGFQEVVALKGGGVGQSPDYWDNAYFDDVYFHNGNPEQFQGYCTDVFFQEAMRFMEKHIEQKEPFFCYLATNAPHSPFHCPDEFWKPFQKKGVTDEEAVFFGMIANLDQNVGKLRAWMKDNGIEDNTILIFLSDNGTATGSRVFNAEMKGHKGSEYEGGHRVPLFVRWPDGGIDRGREVRELTAHIDLLPTLIELCGLRGPSPYFFDGQSLVSLLFDLPISFPDRALTVDSQRVKTPLMWKNCSVMTQQWRLINGDELYDIEKDPGQTRDVSADYPEVVKRLREEYEAWWADLTPDMSNLPRIVIGSEKEPETMLCVHDCVPEGAGIAWHQGMVRLGQGSVGTWSLEAEADANYRFSVTRYPREAQTAICAPMAPGKAVQGLRAYREEPGIAIPAVKVVLEINGEIRVIEVTSNALEVSAEVELKQGPFELSIWFEDAEGNQYPAYYTYVTRVN